jgi:hypothetical protein
MEAAKFTKMMKVSKAYVYMNTIMTIRKHADTLTL